MNKEKAILRIHKYGKVGKIISIVMLVIVAFSMLGTLVAAITLKVLPKDLLTINIGTQAEMILKPSVVGAVDDSVLKVIDEAFDSGSAGLNMGAVSLKFDTAEIVGDSVVASAGKGETNVSLDKIGNALFMPFLTLLITLISIIFAVALCREFQKCESPFDDAVIKKMRMFAFSLIPWTLFSTFSNIALNSVFGNNLEVGISLNMNIVFAVISVLALSVVFKYGAILQKESDETL